MAKQLTNKPLVEALLEVRWKLAEEDDGTVHDPMYPFFIARFWDRVRGSYPSRETLPAARIPDEFTPFVVKYRFRKGQDAWPAVQVGPGVASLNFTENYHWDAFRDAALAFYPDLVDSYGDDSQDLQPMSMLLRYINVVDLPSDEDPIAFVAKKLNTEIRLPTAIPGERAPDSVASMLDLRIAYPLLEPAALGALRVTLSTSEESQAVVWELNVFSTESDIPRGTHDFGKWLESAHYVVEDWFFSLIQGELEAQFGEETNG